MLSDKSPDKLLSKSNLKVGITSTHFGIEPNDYKCSNKGID